MSEMTIEANGVEYTFEKQELLLRALRSLEPVKSVSKKGDGITVTVERSHSRSVTRTIHKHGYVPLDISGGAQSYDHYIYAVEEDSDLLR